MGDQILEARRVTEYTWIQGNRNGNSVRMPAAGCDQEWVRQLRLLRNKMYIFSHFLQ
jgi:hypothetical protein